MILVVLTSLFASKHIKITYLTSTGANYPTTTRTKKMNKIEW